MEFQDSPGSTSQGLAEQPELRLTNEVGHGEETAKRVGRRLAAIAEVQAGVRCIQCQQPEPPVWFGLCERCAIEDATGSSELLWETPFQESGGGSEKR